jgi:hypothetical protein
MRELANDLRIVGRRVAVVSPAKPEGEKKEAGHYSGLSMRTGHYAIDTKTTRLV